MWLTVKIPCDQTDSMKFHFPAFHPRRKLYQTSKTRFSPFEHPLERVIATTSAIISVENNSNKLRGTYFLILLLDIIPWPGVSTTEGN